MEMEFISKTFTFLGEFMIGYTAIAVHYRFWREHKVDKKVFESMKKERLLGILGLMSLAFGYLLQIAIKIIN